MILQPAGPCGTCQGQSPGQPGIAVRRILVSEDQVDEARRILDAAEKAASSDVVESEVSVEETVAGVLDELKKVRSRVETNTALIVLLKRRARASSGAVPRSFSWARVHLGYDFRGKRAGMCKHRRW